MRTICITSFHSLISRNILSTGLLAELRRDPGTRILLLVPRHKHGFFARAFGGEEIEIVGIDHRPSRWDAIILGVALAALLSRSMAIRRRWEFAGNRRYVALVLKSLLAWLMAGRDSAQRLVRRLDHTFGSRGEFPAVFSVLPPDLLFATDIQHEADLAAMRSGRDLGIPVIGMTRSWDNPTAKGLIRFVPDTAVVQNEIIRNELIRLHRIPAERIRVIGIPHYDRYRRRDTPSRDQFLRALGFDPAHRLILFAPIGDRHIRANVTDRAVLDLLVSARQRGELPHDLSVLVRLPVTIPVSLGDFEPPPWIKIEQPGQEFLPGTLKDNELAREDERHLTASLSSCDLLITGPSTLAIDAAIFNTPIVLVNFDNGGRGYWGSIRSWYDYDHFQPILKSGGCRLVHDAAECLSAIQRYLRHPEADRSGRERIVQEQCFRCDGQASERLASAVGAAMGSPAKA